MSPSRRDVPRPWTAAVIGGEHAGAETLEVAEAVGAGLAKSGFTIVTGGLGGVMEAASRGARNAGATVVAVLPGLDPDEANEFAEIVIPTGTGHARNLAVVAGGDVVIAVEGEWGTLSEIGFARKLGKPVVVLGGWRLEHSHLETGLNYAGTADQAVELAEQLAAARQERQ